MNIFSTLLQHIWAPLFLVVVVMGAWLTGRRSGKHQGKVNAEVESYKKMLKQQDTTTNRIMNDMEAVHDVQESDNHLNDTDARKRMRQSRHHNDQ